MELLFSLLSGGATGLVGSVISRFADFKLEKMRGEQKLLMVDKETEAMKIESEFNYRIAETEAETERDVSADLALSSSYGEDKSSYLAAASGPVTKFFMGIVDFLRGLIRPATTIYLLGLTTLIAYQLHEIISWSDMMTIQEAYDMWREVISTVLYLTTAAVLWWFGSRPKAR